MLTTFGFIPCSGTYNGYEFTRATYGTGVTGFGTRPWSEVVPADNLWLVPRACPASDQVEYRPGQKRVQYWDWTELWLGYPSITYSWPIIDEADIALIRTGYKNAKEHCQSRCWLMLYSAETDLYRITSGIIQPPDFVSGPGRLGDSFKLTFTRLGFHANIATTGGGSPYKSVFPTGLEFDNNNWRF